MRKWRAGAERKLTLWQKIWTYYRWPLLAAVAVAGLGGLAWYRYSVSDYRYGDTATEYERAWTKCIADHTRNTSQDTDIDAASSACVGEIDEHRAR